MRKHLDARHILLDYLYTIIISVLIALFLTIVGISKPFLPNLVMSLSFGVSICTLIILLFLLFNPGQGKALPIVFILAAGVIGGNIIGSQAGPFILRHFFSINIDVLQEGHHLKTVVMALVFGGAATYFFYSRAQLKSVSEAAEKERFNRLTSEKAVLEGNLRLLQAQIEPHFLFNTLSNVLSLIDTEPVKGKSMLMDLISYLRTSLSRTLPETTTLGQEIAMIKAYLNIQQIRMGERLSFTIDIPDTIREHPFPPMLLQPLVENAIKHGLEPSIDGGEILIKAIEVNNLIRVAVLDTGSGFSSENKTGVGIRNVRERIKLLYGEKGRFIIEENRPNGVRAIIEVPKHDL
ncbi:MAG: histidine kinase [Proteobacteria bacterium]|nr:histidine kinase [Pseudomonadota bacterium]